MTTNLDARNLSLEDVHHFLRYEEYSNGSITYLRSQNFRESNFSVGADYKWIELLVYPYPARKSPNLSNLTGSEPD
jgi:hypothetical protein